MEPQQQHDDSGSSSKNSSYLCRQSSTRWIPTADQIRILRELYYNNGVRSPTAEQIQKISTRLRQYGKIEGKNVFYWFQNHKARERQKKRFTHNVDVAMQRGGWKVEGKCNAYNGGGSSHGVLGVGQMGRNGCGSVLIENSFRDCSLTGNSSSHGRGFESSYGFLDNRNPEEMEREMEEIETLQLFPMHDEETAGFCPEKSSGEYFSDWYFDEEDKGACSASLELTLNSYSDGDYTRS